MSGKNVVLADTVNMDNPGLVFAEVRSIIGRLSNGFDFSRLDRVFADTVDLFNGNYPGYLRCATQYHDLRHTTDVLLALARLIHGAFVAGVGFSDREVTLALVGALFHDAGYLQAVDDVHGTGAKYTLTHVGRSVGFMSGYFAANGWGEDDAEFCRTIIWCTCHGEKISRIAFASPECELLGKMLATADLLGQLADRMYLEKLLFLYREFRECNLMGIESELDLLRSTADFYESVKKRLASDLADVNRFMRDHFRTCWDVDRNLYMAAADRNVAYLEFLLNNHERDYRKKLQRGGVAGVIKRQESRKG